MNNNKWNTRVSLIIQLVVATLSFDSKKDETEIIHKIINYLNMLFRYEVGDTDDN